MSRNLKVSLFAAILFGGLVALLEDLPRAVLLARNWQETVGSVYGIGAHGVLLVRYRIGDREYSASFVRGIEVPGGGVRVFYDPQNPARSLWRSPPVAVSASVYSSLLATALAVIASFRYHGVLRSGRLTNLKVSLQHEATPRIMILLVMLFSCAGAVVTVVLRPTEAHSVSFAVQGVAAFTGLLLMLREAGRGCGWSELLRDARFRIGLLLTGAGCVAGILRSVS